MTRAALANPHRLTQRANLLADVKRSSATKYRRSN